MPGAISLELFGNLKFRYGGQPLGSINTNRLQSLLGFLVLESDTPQPREQLAYLLWPESGESQARTNLRQLLHNLRRALPADCALLVADNHTVLWRRDPDCTVDVAEFDRALTDASHRGDPDAERDALERAARLHQDDLLRGLYDSWIEPKRQHYRHQLSIVLTRLAALYEDRGEFPAAILHAERLVAQDPLRESHHQLLIRLHAGNRDRAAALRAYHQCMRALRRELGVDPSPDTRALYDQVLRAESPQPARIQPPAATPSLPWPLIGRQKEWEGLVECWRQVSRRGTHFAAILGEPGIGKSRLAEELFEWCGHSGRAVARARCYAAQGQLAYAPIAEWLRAAALESARAGLPQSQLGELARVLPEILAQHPQIPRPHPLTESWERVHLYESLNAAFAAAPKPLLLLIDDLQWCDAESIDWMQSLLRSDAARGILILGTARSEEIGRDHPFARLLRVLEQSGQLTGFPLEALDSDDTARLANRVAGAEFDASTLAGLFRATKGHPLFVIETVRAGVGNAETSTPPRIHAVIAGRLAQLSPPAYELAGFAAATGTGFSFDLLARATDWDEDSLARSLEELWQRRIVAGQREYDFTHDRLREVVYAELSPVRRRFLHRRIAHALEELHAAEPEAISGQLAAHYEAAGMAEHAIRHYRIAAGVARQRFADLETAATLRRALALCREFPETPRRDRQELELLVALGPALVSTQGYAMAEAGETYSRALQLSERLGETQHRYAALSGSWVFHVVRGRLEESRGLAEEFLHLATAAGEPGLLMAGHFMLGSSTFQLGRFVASNDHLSQALAAWRGPSDSALALFAGPDVRVFSQSYQSHVLWQLGYGDRAMSASQDAIAAAGAVGHPFSRAISLSYRAMLHVFRRESREALRWAEEASGVCRQHAFAYYLSMAEIVAGWAMAMEGHPQDAHLRFRRGLDSLKATGAEVRLPFYYGLLAEICAQTGQPGDALAHISTGLAFQNKNAELWATSDLHRIHGDLLLEAGNPEQAHASYRRAIEAAQQTGGRLFELRAAARICLLRLDPEAASEARSALQRLYQGFTEGAQTPDLLEAERRIHPPQNAFRTPGMAN